MESKTELLSLEFTINFTELILPILTSNNFSIYSIVDGVFQIRVVLEKL